MINIVNAQYVSDIFSNENTAINCQINGEYYSVPLDPNNSDYAEILRQVAAGTLTIADAD
jgi:hypothetical protein